MYDNNIVEIKIKSAKQEFIEYITGNKIEHLKKLIIQEKLDINMIINDKNWSALIYLHQK